ncbi:hypothetical protein [Phenylobacterium zucineum]|uniref:hypothetical protein n=1 Tax=Phenylobacterium zucineum TaxID=284016 RepID=UPI000313AEC7|nr:hypothetical protein [Phenylobacterium zucineum]
MTRAELYLQEAAEAEAAAAAVRSHTNRLRYLDLAEGYRALAERVRTLEEPRSWQGAAGRGQAQAQA